MIGWISSQVITLPGSIAVLTNRAAREITAMMTPAIREKSPSMKGRKSLTGMAKVGLNVRQLVSHVYRASNEQEAELCRNRCEQLNQTDGMRT
jgi:hypothetical protein